MMHIFFAPYLVETSERIQYIAHPGLWWLDTAFGKLVFVMFFLTWGLVIILLALLALSLIRSLVRGNKTGNK